MVRKTKNDVTKLVNLVNEGLLEVKGEDIVTIDLSNIDSAVCKYFIICHGNSNTHVEALARSAERYVREQSGEKVWKKEGMGNSQWIILDYSDVVLHIFQKEYRDYYRLEELWADAPRVAINS